MNSRLLCAAAMSLSLAAAPGIDATALLRDLELLASDEMEGRRPGTAGHDRARAYIVRRFGESGLEPVGGAYEQAFTFAARPGGTPARQRGTNVIGLVRGRIRPGLAFVVTAHYDHLGVRNGVVFNGANDNASGTAALFALASSLTAHPPAHTFIFAALDAEEAGLAGARALLDAPPVSRDAIVANVNLDMIARDPGNTLYAAGTFHHPHLKPALQRVARRAAVRLVFGHDGPGAPRVEDWTRGSDHYAFHQLGIPFVYFGVEDVAHHHKASDDFGTISREFYANAVETIAAALEELDRPAAGIPLNSSSRIDSAHARSPKERQSKRP